LKQMREMLCGGQRETKDSSIAPEAMVLVDSRITAIKDQLTFGWLSPRKRALIASVPIFPQLKGR
jgi:hypothetical protein